MQTTETDNGRGRADVQAVLDRLSEGVTAGDGAAVAKLWSTPAYVLGDGMARGIQTREEIAEFFGSAKEQYNEKGITDTRAEITRLEWLTDGIALVDVRFPYLDGKGQENGEERSTYTLRRDDAGDLKIAVAVMRGATGTS